MREFGMDESHGEFYDEYDEVISLERIVDCP